MARMDSPVRRLCEAVEFGTRRARRPVRRLSEAVELELAGLGGVSQWNDLVYATSPALIPYETEYRRAKDVGDAIWRQNVETGCSAFVPSNRQADVDLTSGVAAAGRLLMSMETWMFHSLPSAPRCRQLCKWNN